MNFLDCKISLSPYDEENHLPRSAPGGHEFCTSCIRGLNNECTDICPKCRRVSTVEVPDDLPINYDLTHVIRDYKSMNISPNKESVSFQSETTNYELCSIHSKTIRHWCLKCQIWICEDCFETHSTLFGCSTEDMNSMKYKNIKDADIILAAYEEEAMDISAKIQAHIELAERHAEKAQNFRKVLDQGNTHKKKLLKCKEDLNSANSSHAIIEGMKVLTQRKQLLRSWYATNIIANTPLGLIKQAFEDKNYIFTEKVIGYHKVFGKITKHGKNIYLHTFWNQEVADSSFCIPFEDLKKDIPSCSSLVFLELSLGCFKMGQVLIRLNEDLPNIREYMVKIVTGEDGHSLRDIKFTQARAYDIYANKLPINYAMTITTETRVSTAKYGNILGYFNSGYLSCIFWYISKTPNSNYSNHFLIGTVEYGMDTVLECHNKHTKCDPMTISDCGLVIEDN